MHFIPLSITITGRFLVAHAIAMTMINRKGYVQIHCRYKGFSMSLSKLRAYLIFLVINVTDTSVRKLYNMHIADTCLAKQRPE